MNCTITSASAPTPTALQCTAATAAKQEQKLPSWWYCVGRANASAPSTSLHPYCHVARTALGGGAPLSKASRSETRGYRPGGVGVSRANTLRTSQYVGRSASLNTGRLPKGASSPALPAAPNTRPAVAAAAAPAIKTHIVHAHGNSPYSYKVVAPAPFEAVKQQNIWQPSNMQTGELPENYTNVCTAHCPAATVSTALTCCLLWLCPTGHHDE